jgi:hypothetical protein
MDIDALVRQYRSIPMRDILTELVAARAEVARLREAHTEAERLVHDAGKFIECWSATRDDKHATIVVSRRLLRNFLASHEALRQALALTATPTDTQEP